MHYLAYEAAMAAPGENGQTRRAELEASARHGNVFAIAALRCPEYPEALGYLDEWVHELVGRSGAHMGGLAPLSYDVIEAWAEKTYRDPTPEDMVALTLLDGALLHPDETLKQFTDPDGPDAAGAA